MRAFATIAALSTLLTAGAARAETSASNGWCEIHLTATDYTEINLLYRTVGPFHRGGSIDVSPLAISISRPGLEVTNHVRAVVIDKGAFNSEKTRELDLTIAAGGIFAGQLDLLTSVDNTQEIAVVIDGVWLQDPINGTSNFKFSLGENASSCSAQ